MDKLTDYNSYQDAKRFFSKEALWSLLDGDKKSLNIAHECVDRHAAVNPGTAIRVAHSDGRDEIISFPALAEWSNRFANYLLSIGISPGDRVAVMLEPSLLFYAALFGTMKARAVVVPLFTLFGPDGLRARVSDCNPKIFFHTIERRALAKEINITSVIADDFFLSFLKKQSAYFEIESRADDVALLQYTSGTSRETPEAIRHHHRSVVTVLIAALYGTGIRQGDRFMCPSSPAWGHGLWHGTIAPLALGVETCTYAGKFDPDRLMQALQDFKITSISAAATHFRMMKNSGTSDNYKFQLEKLTYTGEPIDTSTAQWIETTFGRRVCSIYGTTEVGVIIANYPTADDLPIKPGALGKPVPGVQVAIINAEGEECPSGITGEIKVFTKTGWVSTKDLGHTDDDGFFYHDGRGDDVIISAGWTMSAVEIEDVLLKHKDVLEVAVIAVPDRGRGNVAKAFVVSERDRDDIFIEEIKLFVRKRLSLHEYPRQIEFVSELPKTFAGKINRRLLRLNEDANK